MAREGYPVDLILCERFGYTPTQVRGLPNRDWLELLAYVRLRNERESRTPTFQRKAR